MADVCDLNGIKTELKSLFESANTVGASPVDLSNNMTRRVQKVLTVNPEQIYPQASFFPFVTSYIRSKTIQAEDIAGNQLSAKRKTEINIEVVGGVFNQNTSDKTADPADNDINYLMENVELVLRSNPTLNGKIKWQKPSDVQYYTSVLDARNHIRFGILRLTAVAFY